MKKESSRTKQAAATKKRLLKNGMRLITEKGVDNVAVEEIAKAAGVSVGTFYYYFPSKLDLVASIRWKIDAYFEQEVADLLNADTCRQNLRIFFYHYAKHTEENGWNIIFSLIASDSAMVISGDRFLQLLLQDLLTQGQNAGELTREISAREMMRELLVIAHGIVLDWAINKGETDIYKDMERIMARVVKAYLL